MIESYNYEDLPVDLDDEIDMLTCDVSNIMNNFNESRYILEKKLSHSEQKELVSKLRDIEMILYKLQKVYLDE